MRVAIVCGGGILSGKEIMVLELADGLRNSGYDLEIVNSLWTDGNFARRLDEMGLRTHPVWFGFISMTMSPASLYMTFAQIVRWPQLLAGYRRFLRRFKPDKVIHTNWHSLLTISPFVKSERDIYWVHEVMPKKPQYLKFFRWLQRRLQCFVAVSNAVADSLRELGVSPDKLRMIYNGIIDPTRGAARVHGRAEELKIGIVGQVGPWKGHQDLLEAFRAVLRRYPTTELRIFGKGSLEYEAVLRHRAIELGVEEKVIWRGFVKNMTDAYRELDLLVAPSRSEDPLPTAAIEAAFFEIPVIASRRGGLVEIVEDGVTGYLFEAGDTAALAKHMIALLENAALRATIGQNARRRALALFSRGRFVQDFTDLLEIKSANARQNGHRIDHAA
jgi:glycosyltransferase involved in cell wall biosynthesis